MTKATHADVRVHLALLVVQLFFGGFSVVGKYVLGYIPPLAVAGLRVCFAAPVLLVLAWRFDHRLPAARDLRILAMLGLFGVCLNQVMFIVGLQYTTAVNASILMPAIPVFTVLVAAVARIERMTIRTSAGVILSVAGALVMLDVSNFHLGDDTILGNTLVLLNCLSYALFLVYSRPVLLRLPPMTVIAWSYVFGGAGVLLISGPTMLATDFTALPFAVWTGVAYIVLLATLTGYILNTWAIKYSSSALVATYTTLQPVIAGALAVAFLGESVTWKEVAGFLLIIAGLLRISLRSR